MPSIATEISEQSTDKDKALLSSKYLLLYILVFSCSLAFNTLIDKFFKLFSGKVTIFLQLGYVILLFTLTVLMSVYTLKN